MSNVVKKMNQKKYDKIKQAFAMTAGKMASNLYMRTISEAMMGMMPIMMISSVASLLNAINFWGIKPFFQSIGLTKLFEQINAMTISIVAVYVAILISYKLAINLKHDPLNATIVGTLSFFILSNLSVEDKTQFLNLVDLGSAGIFVAMIGGLLGTRLYIFFMEKKLTIKMPDSVPPVVQKTFESILPGILVATVMGGIFLLVSLSSQASMINLINTLLQKPLLSLGSNIFAAMFIVAFIELIWFFGIHGVLAIYPVLMMVYQQPQMTNLEAYSAGQALPFLFTTGFILNNRGARSFAVALLAIFKCKSEQLKSVGKLSVIPSMFGISEPVKFGLPQIMNIRMLIPLMLTPAVSVFSAWLLTIIGFLPYQNGGNLPTGFPIIFGGFLTNGWQGIVAQLVQLILCVLIYIPFMKSQDLAYLEEEKAVFETKNKQ
ncbi:PTS sugar transporter subunit IIC [Lactococcus ileimucosae]|uniref:PTS sugar transporter subunit IIC n=1 Tax=Lactococcus ileimucosae TaxID=2941329 RepID=UPI0020440CB4|nr:PTS transporter subunit EIIC [Lactococcus ileimucosae]